MAIIQHDKHTAELTGQDLADYLMQRFNQKESQPMKDITGSGFFYIDGIPTKGEWIDLRFLTEWEEIKEELAKALNIEADSIDEVLCADIDGLARHFYYSGADSFDLSAWVDFREALEASHLDAEVADAYLENCGSGTISEIEDAYSGQWDSWEDFAYDMAENCFSIPKEIAPYFDYEKFGRDLSYDYFEVNGYFFRNC